MHRKILGLVAFLILGFGTFAEEIVLKDGTKIVGKLNAVNGDKIEVETAYGKMQINRSDIVSITFPQNGPANIPAATEEKKPATPVDESLTGTKYVNRTGDFTLTFPNGWKINTDLRTSTQAVAALSSTDDLRYLMVVKEAYTASPESFEGLIEIQAKKNLQDYAKLSDQPTTIDGKPSRLLSYRGISPQAENLPIQFLVAVIPSPGGYLRITTWCVEPLYKETQETFEKIIRSFHSPVGSASASSEK
jgi:hypothetical protein